MNKGQKLLKKAKKIIPGGNQLLSKRSEIFLPGMWPTYYKKAKGCKVWDLNNKMYYDFAGMGVTACVLGYSDNDINKSIIEGLKKGSMCTLNATEEIDLANELLNIHKWSGMAKFCKSGGEACMVAIRIARAFTNKKNITSLVISHDPLSINQICDEVIFMENGEIGWNGKVSDMKNSKHKLLTDYLSSTRINK